MQIVSCRYKEAEDDDLSIRAVAPEDPAAWNNLGNTNIGLGNYDAAAKYFQRAINLSPTFSFAAANRCSPSSVGDAQHSPCISQLAQKTGKAFFFKDG